MMPGDMTNTAKGTDVPPSTDRFGSLEAMARVDPWQVARLGLAFGILLLLPLALLMMAYHLLGLAESPSAPAFRLEVLWGAMTVLLGLAMAVTLAYAIARQRTLAKVLEQAVNNMPVHFAYVDADCRYRFNNRAYIEACSRDSRDIHGKTMRQVLGEENYPKVETNLGRALAGQRVDFELRLDEGARTRDLSVTYLPDVASGGRVKGLFVLANDVTDRKRAERREKEQMLELAHFSRLAGVGEIAAEIAHQINQPLAAIAMFSSAAERTLAGGGDRAQVLGWLATINAQSKRASEVIGNLRRYVRPDKMEKVVLDVNVPVGEVASMLAHDAASRQVGLRLELASVLPPVLASAILIEQVVFNLARNAILAVGGQSTKGLVTLRTRAEGGRVWVEVLHDGPCLVADCCQGLDKQEGGWPDGDIGTSLTVNRSIIASFEGEIGCRCDEGGGTVCFFHLPRCEQ